MQIDRVQADALLTTTRAVRRRMDFDRPVKRSVLEERWSQLFRQFLSVISGSLPPLVRLPGVWTVG